MMKEVPLYHQMNGGIHMNQLVTGKSQSVSRTDTARSCTGSTGEKRYSEPVNGQKNRGALAPLS